MREQQAVTVKHLIDQSQVLRDNDRAVLFGDNCDHPDMKQAAARYSRQSDYDRQLLNNIVDCCAQARGIPAPPVTLLRSKTFQAYVEDGEMFFSVIMLRFPIDVIIAIVHHELEHIIRRHGRWSYPLVNIAIGVSIVLLTGIAFGWVPSLMVLFIPLSHVLYTLSRHRGELQADAASVKYGTLTGMLTFNKRAESIHRRWFEFFKHLSHPSSARRIRHIRRCVKHIEGHQ